MECLHPGGLSLTRRLLEYCDLNPSAKVADIGCGTGATLRYLLANYGIGAIGVDLAAERLKEAQDSSPDLRLLTAAAENLPFPDACLDTVIAECSLSVMQDSERVLAEINRVLATGGKLAVSDVYARAVGPDLPSLFFTYGTLTKFLTKNHFKILVWEDHLPCLAEFTASFIMEHGSTEKLWEGIAAAKSGQDVKNYKLSYFLLVAEKMPK